jgi:MFS transporter, Spinster family, sphingosine-1-phosphate transporter
VLSEGLKAYVGAKAAQSIIGDNRTSGDLQALSLVAENTTMLATTEAPPTLLQMTTEFQSLQYALFSTCFVEVIGGVFFLITSFYVLRDKRNADLAIRGKKF